MVLVCQLTSDQNLEETQNIKKKKSFSNNDKNKQPVMKGISQKSRRDSLVQKLASKR